MGEKDRLDGRRRCLAPGHLEQVFSVNALDVRYEAHLDKVNNAICCPGVEILLKVFCSSREAFSKIQQDRGVLVAEKYLVASDLIYSAIERNSGSSRQTTTFSFGSLSR